MFKIYFLQKTCLYSSYNIVLALASWSSCELKHSTNCSIFHTSETLLVSHLGYKLKVLDQFPKLNFANITCGP